MRVAARLLLGTVGILLFAVIVMVWSSRTALRRHLELQLQSDIEQEARLIQAALPDDPAAWDRLVGRWAALRTHRVTLFDSAGHAIADNQVPPSVLAGQADAVSRPQPLYWRLDMAPDNLHMALRQGPWKIVAARDLTKVELYDLAADPRETADRAAAEPARLAAMTAALREHNLAVEKEGPDWWRRLSANGGTDPAKAKKK